MLDIKQKQYRENHKEKIAQRKKHYYEVNKEKINEKRSKKFTCECRNGYTLRNKASHEKTFKHINFMKQPEANN